MLTDIKRYSVDNGTIKANPDGKWVRYDAHQKVVDALHEEIKELLGEKSKMVVENHLLGENIEAIELAMLRVLQDKYGTTSGPTGSQ